MRRDTLYKIHKWIAVTVGMFILMWLISGIVMILPRTSNGPGTNQKLAPVNFREITMSPAQAIANLEKTLGSHMDVNSVSLRRIRGTMLYKINVKPGNSHLIDVRTGRLFIITTEVAEQIARDEFSLQAHVLQIKSVDRNDYFYPWGPLPAYRIIFDDNWATVSHVSTSDGTVRSSNRLNRIKAAIGSLHTFEPLKLITKQSNVRKGLLVLLSLVGIGVALTGYYLALPPRWLSRYKLTRHSVVPPRKAG